VKGIFSSDIILKKSQISVQKKTFQLSDYISHLNEFLNIEILQYITLCHILIQLLNI
jgi:poly-beta-hydroxyalkanoate depolymerase